MVHLRQILSFPVHAVQSALCGHPVWRLAAPPAAIAVGLSLGMGMATVCDQLAYAQSPPGQGSPAQAPFSQGSTQPRPATDAGDSFTVSGVSVDVSAPDTNAARDRAIAQAQRKAWDELARRNLAPGTAAPPVDDATLSRAVQNFSVDDERLAPGRYQASMTFRFRPEAVRQVLGAAIGTAPATAAAGNAAPLLVLPVTVQPDGTAVLWEDRTPWRAAWEDRDANPAQAKSSTVKLEVPFGDLPDVAAASGADAVAGNRVALAKIAAAHNAAGVVVARTTLPPPGSVTPIQVVVSVYNSDGPRGSRTLTVNPDRDDRAEDLLNRAVVFAVAAADELLREQTAAAAAPPQSLIATAPLASLPAWIDMRQRLGQLGGAGVRVDLLSLNRTAATISIGYRGDVAAVQSEAARQGLMLSQNAGSWVVSAAPVAAPAPAAQPAAALPPAPQSQVLQRP